jgi:hypothetical protein
MRRSRALLLALSLLATIAVLPRLSEATLGGSADSVAGDRKALSAVRRATKARNGYTVQEIESDSTIVREYVSASGIVFAIAWNGLIHPDLTQLLGSYADQYKKALKQTVRSPGRRRQQIKTNSVVVEKWGHMRNLQGRAYAPDLIPYGVSVDDIK